MINLIGINGYIGSGKDTVGQIIQYLTTDKKTISYSGSYNSYIMDLGMGSSIISPWEIKKFAAKLKQIASLLTGIPAEKFEDQEFKKTNLGKEWKIPTEIWFEGERKPDWEEEKSIMTVRNFLQKLGTEGIRNGVHTNAWVNALFADYKPTFQPDNIVPLPKEYSKWIITDTRFPNEAQAIKNRGGIVVRVERRFYSEDKLSSTQVILMDLSSKHPSETALNSWPFDYTIENNSTIEDLTEKVREMLIHFNIIS